MSWRQQRDIPRGKTHSSREGRILRASPRSPRSPFPRLDDWPRIGPHEIIVGRFVPKHWDAWLNTGVRGDCRSAGQDCPSLRIIEVNCNRDIIAALTSRLGHRNKINPPTRTEYSIRKVRMKHAAAIPRRYRDVWEFVTLYFCHETAAWPTIYEDQQGSQKFRMPVFFSTGLDWRRGLKYVLVPGGCSSLDRSWSYWLLPWNACNGIVDYRC